MKLSYFFLCRAILVLLLAFSFAGANAVSAAGKTNEWVSLFNGRDLSGWTIILGQPESGTETRQPKEVFKVVQTDGEPAIRVSGEGLAGLTSDGSYENYHLELEFKWGEGRFWPRADAPRDSGLLYHGSSEHAPGTGWIESMEFGILEGGETGDFWSVPGPVTQSVVVDVAGEDIPEDKRRYHEQAIRYRPGGKKYTAIKSGILNSQDYEKPRGQWNKLDLICFGQTAIHVVNGKVNLVLTHSRRQINGKVEPLTRGRLQLQCEGAETFFRKIRVRQISEIPPQFR